jgi:hypothetical protein
MISKGALFIHIPRCGGTSVETYFGNILGHHASWDWYREHHLEAWLESFKFAFVRDVYSRLESLYGYWAHVSMAEWYGELDQRDDIKQRQQDLFTARIRSFDEMLHEIPALRKEAWTDGHFRTQRSYLPPGIMAPVHVYALDRVAEIFPYLAWRNKWGGTGHLPRKNASGWGREKVEWTEERKRLAQRHFKEDLTFN